MKKSFLAFKGPLAVVFIFLSTWVMSAEYFRYKDENGVQVINTYVPPEYVKNGYDVITSSGQVLKRVPPAPTEEELAARDEAKRLAEERRRQAAEQRMTDERLKKLYTHPDDARRALERKMAEVDYQVSRKRGQLATLKSKKEKLEKQAAERERAGGKVHEQTFEEIQRLQRQIAEGEEKIAEIEQGKGSIRDAFQRDIDRMVELYQEQAKHRKAQ